MLINSNLSLLNTLNKNNKKIEKSMEKLSSGLRINNASDDSAGLAISEKMRAQIRGLNQAQRNVQDGISLIQTTEGGLSDIQDNLQRVRELAVQASNDTLTNEDRQQIQKEVLQIKQGINNIANNTEFNGIKLLNRANTISPTVETTPLTGGQVNVTITSPLGNSPTETVSNLINSLNMVKSGSIGDSDAQRIASSFSAIQQNGSDFLIYNNQGYGWAGGAQPGNIQNLGFINIYAGYRFDNQVSNNDAIVFGGIVNNSTYQVYGNFELRFAPNQQKTENVTLQVGANSGDTFQVELTDARTNALGIDDIDLTPRQGAESAISNLDNALEKVSSERGKFGAYQNALDHIHNNVSNYEMNLTDSESRISDTDIAKQMMEMAKSQILSQASQAMLAQANQQQQQVLQLLK